MTYGSELAPWVRSFNECKLPDADAGANWTVLSAPSHSLRQLPAERGGPLYEAIDGSPYGNELLVEFAGELLNRNGLEYDATDLLAVSFSSNDGWSYLRPRLATVSDIAVRNDRAIGRLLEPGRQNRRPALTR